MEENTRAPRIVVGVDGSEGSVEALRQAHRIAAPLGARIEATACWDYPRMADGYELMGIGGFEERAGEILEETLVKAYGDERPASVESVVRQGNARPILIEASRDADMLIVGRRGHGGFHGLLLGSVSSACVARAHCPVLVVHAPDRKADKKAEARPS